MNGQSASSMSWMDRTRSAVKSSTGVDLEMALIVVLVCIVVGAAAYWMWKKESMTSPLGSSPIKNSSSTGTPNPLTGGNNSMWANGSDSAGGLFDSSGVRAVYVDKAGNVLSTQAAPVADPNSLNAAALAAGRQSVNPRDASTDIDFGVDDSGPSLKSVQLGSCSGAPSPDSIQDQQMLAMFNA